MFTKKQITLASSETIGLLGNCTLEPLACHRNETYDEKINNVTLNQLPLPLFASLSWTQGSFRVQTVNNERKCGQLV